MYIKDTRIYRLGEVLIIIRLSVDTSCCYNFDLYVITLSVWCNDVSVTNMFMFTLIPLCNSSQSAK